MTLFNLFFVILPPKKNKTSIIMKIKELYSIYEQHPVITTDSRDCPEGSIFLALKGESFDGNKFAVAALQKGCAVAIIDDQQVYADNPQLADSGQLILVDNTLQTFKDLAREHRRKFLIPVIGITGTNGKTTTKELIRAVLAEKYNVLATEGNFNNDVGVPKTLFRLSDEHEIAIIEMGASHPGDIKTLVETAEPTTGLITNVGRAHLQGFGSFEGVKRTKGELYDFLASKGCIDNFVVNADDADLVEMAEQRFGVSVSKVIGTPYSLNSNDTRAYVVGKVVACDPYLRFTWRMTAGQADEMPYYEVTTKLIGTYNVYNALAAIVMGIRFGVAPEQICHAIENYTPSNNRSQLTVTAHNRLIVDAYNANPTSMLAALKNFRDMQVDNKMAILGDMRELGEVSQEEHAKIVGFIEESGLKNVWLVGDEFGKTACSFRKFQNVDEVKAEVAKQRPEGCCILIKGSNSMRLFQLVELL